ncbi:MAG: GlxA family transcriptional regulator [Deltaproteobacteria bacterium]|nr:GlxA family transcriptional regulator [Deltaproteobacteria bacterium]
MLKIAILALENCMCSSVTGPIDIFSVACREWKKISANKEAFCDIKIVSYDGKPVTGFNGLLITPHQGMSAADCFDILIVPVLFGDLDAIIGHREVIGWIKEQHAGGACVCTVCAGSFLAAEAGLLTGRKATTHWLLADAFRQKYPDVILKPEKMLVDEGDCVSSGGVTAYLDLCLYIAGRFGSPELVSSLSKILLIDPARQAQSPYQTYSFQKAHGDQEILKVQGWLDMHFNEEISVPDLAGIAGLGERTFARRFKKATADTPLEYVQMMRIEKARRMLESTNEGMDAIITQIGYDDLSSFRRLFKKHTGLSPSAYRRRFSTYYSFTS